MVVVMVLMVMMMVVVGRGGDDGRDVKFLGHYKKKRSVNRNVQ